MTAPEEADLIARGDEDCKRSLADQDEGYTTGC
jgi:hypothetical protein